MNDVIKGLKVSAKHYRALENYERATGLTDAVEAIESGKVDVYSVLVNGELKLTTLDIEKAKQELTRRANAYESTEKKRERYYVYICPSRLFAEVERYKDDSTAAKIEVIASKLV